MQKTTPPNTVILLKKILPEMIIPGSECVIVTKKIVLLRIAKIEQVSGEDTIFRLATNKDDPHGDLVININEIERAYVVKAKILTNI